MGIDNLCTDNGTLFFVSCDQKEETGLRKGVPFMFEFRNVHGHVEVYDAAGCFLFSADSVREAREELNNA